MKKVKVEFEIEVSDDFEIGDCNKCPLNHTEWYTNEEFTDYYNWCLIDGNCEDKLERLNRF